MDNISDPSSIANTKGMGSPAPAAVTQPQPLSGYVKPASHIAHDLIDAEMDAVEEAVRAAVEAALESEEAAAAQTHAATSVQIASEVSPHTAIETSAPTIVEASAQITVETSAQTAVDSANTTVETAAHDAVETSAHTTVETAAHLTVETPAQTAFDLGAQNVIETFAQIVAEASAPNVVETPTEIPARVTGEAALEAVVKELAKEASDADASFLTHAEVFFKADDENSLLAPVLSEMDQITMAVDAQQLLDAANGHEVAASDGIEILVRLAQKGEIDPKNVDIIDVTDKFLKLIAAAPKENLRQSGKILFHACVLLRMKAEALLNFTAEEPVDDDFIDFEDDEGGLYDSSQPRQITFKDLERAIVRRSQKRQVRKRQVTLEELIAALREAEKIEKTRSERKPPRAVIELAGQHEVDSVDDLLDLAHDEDVETTIVQVELLLARILKLGERIDLMRMVTLMDEHKDWVDAFLASLFLSNAGKIDLYQDEFYGPLFIGLGKAPVSDTVVT
jgi:segregation and condensation protein A